MRISTCLQTAHIAPGTGTQPGGWREDDFDGLLAAMATGPGWWSAAVVTVGSEDHRPPAGRVTPQVTGGAVESSDGHVVAQQVACVATGLQVLSAGHIEFSFVGGPLQGVQCRVEIDGGRVRCRLHSPSAAARKALRSAAGRLARRLAGSGLRLDGFEVQP